MMGPTQQERSQKWRASPKGKYAEQKRKARERGVLFVLRFSEWWAIWTLSGKWNKRGNRKGLYCMCRKGDTGPYAVGNVYIGTWSQNTADRNRSVVVKRHTSRSTSVAWKEEGTKPVVGDEVPF
jgi:hypothetical protein